MHCRANFARRRLRRTERAAHTGIAPVVVERGRAMHPSVSEPLFQKSLLEKVCAYCGARLRLLVASAPEGNEPFDYDCLACGKMYMVEAAMQPQVEQVGPRTDGKDDRYQETMF
jgi:hypothetical protein